MADIEKILRLVAEGALSAEEADHIIAALSQEDVSPRPPAPPTPPPPPAAPAAEGRAGRHLRIEVIEGGRRVVNLRVPLNIAGLATTFIPGLSDDASQQIRQAIAAGMSGRILEIATDDGDRVLIVTE